MTWRRYEAYRSSVVDLHALTGLEKGGPSRPVTLLADTASRAAFARLLVTAGVFRDERTAYRDVARIGREGGVAPDVATKPDTLYAITVEGFVVSVPLGNPEPAKRPRAPRPAPETRAPVLTEADVFARAREAAERTPLAPADDLLPPAVVLTTAGEGEEPHLDVVVRAGSVRLVWRRVYPDGVESDERMTDAPTLSGALAYLVEYERAADELDEHEAAAP